VAIEPRVATVRIARESSDGQVIADGEAYSKSRGQHPG
jgi:hypothetical protein